MGSERAYRYRHSPCKETELIWDYRTAGSEDGRNQGDVYLPSCARTRGCMTAFLDWFQTETLVLRGSVYLPVSLSASVLPPTSTNLIRRLQAAWWRCASQTTPFQSFQLPSFCFVEEVSLGDVRKQTLVFLHLLQLKLFQKRFE